MEEGEEEGLEEKPSKPQPAHQKALQQPAEEDLLRHPGEEGQEKEAFGAGARFPQGSSQGLVEPFGLLEGGGEEVAEEDLEASQEEQKPQAHQGVAHGVGLSPQGQAQEEHPPGAQEEEPPLEAEEEA